MSESEVHNHNLAGHRKRWPFIVLPLLLLLFAANHLEHHWRQQKLQQDNSVPVVQTETNLLTGHTSIGIEENLKSDKRSTVLHFAALGKWVYSPKAPPPCPAGLHELNGREVTCVGFMYPLEAGTAIKTFCLMRTTQTCCYGPRPQYNQYLLVEMKTPTKFERLAPVAVKGKFIIDPQPSQGYIYRMEGNTVVSAADDTPDENPTEAAAKNNLPLFDFSLLNTVAASEHKLPPQLAVWDQRTVLASGYFSGRDTGNPPQLMISDKYRDGVTAGQSPTIYNTIMVYPENQAQMPPAWKNQGIMKGTLRVEKNAALWSKNGIVSLHNAIRLNAGGGIKTDAGLLLGFWEEALLLAACSYWAFRRKKVKDITDPDPS